MLDAILDITLETACMSMVTQWKAAYEKYAEDPNTCTNQEKEQANLFIGLCMRKLTPEIAKR